MTGGSVLCRWWLVALAACLGMMGCAPREDEEAPGRAVIEVRDTAVDPEPIVGAQMGEGVEPGDTFPETFQGTAGIVGKSRSGMELAILQEVRTATHAGFDRVVFEFDGLSVPGYHIEYVDRPVRMARQEALAEETYNFVKPAGKVRTRVAPRRRKAAPSTAAPVVDTIAAGTEVSYVGWTSNGTSVNANAH